MDDLQETSSVSRPQDARPTASQTGISMPGNSGTKPLLDRLGSFKAAERETAVKEVDGLSPEAFTRLLKQHTRRWSQYIRRLGLLFTGWMLLVYFVPLLVTLNPAVKPFWYAANLLMLFIMGWAVCQGFPLRRASKRLDQMRAERITQGGDIGFQQLIEALDALHQAYRELQSGTRTVLPGYRAILWRNRELMIQELSLITEEQATLLTDNHCRILRHWVADETGEFNYDDVDLGLAAMNALVKAGRSGITSLIEKLAKEPQATVNMQRVRQMARVHLKTLRERAAEQTQETTLLRASQAPANPDTLLRPVQTAPDTTPTEQLLRPTTPE